MQTIELDPYDYKLMIVDRINNEKKAQKEIIELERELWNTPDSPTMKYKTKKQKLNTLAVFSLIKSILTP